MLGAPGAGKTSLVRRFVEDCFEEGEGSSIAIAIYKGVLAVSEDTLELMLWDPGAHEALGQYTASFISGASGLVFVVDATKPRTLDHLLDAQARGRGFIGSRPSVLVVNKIDLTADFALSTTQLDAAAQLDWYIAQASAKTGANVRSVFERLAEMMLDARKASA